VQDGESYDSEQDLLMVTTNCDEDGSCWYLDTGCSNHVTENRVWLIDLDLSVKSGVRFADNSTILAEGFGKVLIMINDGKKTFMLDVLYVLSMKNNLLSLGQLLKKGYTMTMQQNLIEVYDSK